MNEQAEDNHVDDHVDEEIEQYLLSNEKKNFFLFAGAGSGKTRSLVKALSLLEVKIGEKLTSNGQQIAVITYTNAAATEISRRLQYKPIYAVSTIHSFLWELIKSFQTDIKQWMIQKSENKIAELKEKRNTPSNQEKIKKEEFRLDNIKRAGYLSYNPNGNNETYKSLDHSDVISMGSDFISNVPIIQKILMLKFPYLLIDESQDTKKELIDALMEVTKEQPNDFTIGMFGDTMQKIYLDGKDNLAACIPDGWRKPKKIMNHRSAKRIVKLANTIRNDVDGQYQCARTDAEEGIVRLFVIKSSADKIPTEKKVTEMMADYTNDPLWKNGNEFKSLILEHHMAASRFNFIDLYEPLNKRNELSTSLRDGTITELSFLSRVILPLRKAYELNDDFEVFKIVKQYSMLLKEDLLLGSKSNQISLIQETDDAVNSLMELWKDGNSPSCLEILQNIVSSNLFTLEKRIDDILDEVIDGEDETITALRKALSVPFDELIRYSEYVNDETQFATHQGVKGLEFPRVMVIMDDDEARGFLFSYEKLFGAKEKTPTDIKNESEGKDSSIIRTKRLFYVACTRAEKSLAVVAYTNNPEKVRQTAIDNNWFKEEEIVLLQEDER